MKQALGNVQESLLRFPAENSSTMVQFPHLLQFVTPDCYQVARRYTFYKLRNLVFVNVSHHCAQYQLKWQTEHAQNALVYWIIYAKLHCVIIKILFLGELLHSPV